MSSRRVNRENIDESGAEENLEEELDEEETRLKRREERFKAQVEKIISSLKQREEKIEFPEERMAQIREWIHEKNPVLHAENYFAKQIKGMIIFKRLIALSTISTINPLNTLVIGDPSTGKSEIGLAYQEVTPRTGYAWGSKLTQAGMTMCTLGRKISLGMLPRCHMGHVMIDEFNRIPPEDTGAVLASMQHGFFGVEKAWLKVERVPARAPITAMANPFPEYFKGVSVEQIRRQIPIQSGALLTRFHFILIILRPTVEEFEEITDHQIRAKRMGTPKCSFDDRERILWRDFVEYQRRRSIYAWAHPQKFQRMIKSFVSECYRQDFKLKRLAIPISPRMTEGMIATCENVAKAQMRTIVTNADVSRSVKLLAYALEPSGLDVALAFKKVKDATGVDLS